MTNCYPFDDSSVKITGHKITVSAPGKVILHGEHSVVYGKLALAASVDLRTKIEISEIDLPNALVVQLHTLKFAYKYDIQKINELLLNQPLPLLKNQKKFNLEFPELIDYEALLKRVDNFIQLTHTDLTAFQALSLKAFFYLLTGILGSTNVQLVPLLVIPSTELSAGAGLGSSASFTVCIAAALLHFIKSKTPGGSFSKSGYKPIDWEYNLIEFNDRELDLVCHWAFCAEKIFHGTPSGLDNTVCTFGSVVEYRRDSPPKLMKASCPLKLLLINSNVPRETKKMVANVAQYRKKYPTVVDHMLESLDAVSSTVVEKIMELTQLSDKDDNTEIYKSLAELYTINHHLLNSIGVGHRKLNQIVDILAEQGLSGKLTGGGGGGYAICLIPPKFDTDRLEKTVELLKSNGFDVINTTLGVDGVRLDIFV